VDEIDKNFDFEENRMNVIDIDVDVLMVYANVKVRNCLDDMFDVKVRMMMMMHVVDVHLLIYYPFQIQFDEIYDDLNMDDELDIMMMLSMNVDLMMSKILVNIHVEDHL
jgi:hypothetical protein